MSATHTIAWLMRATGCDGSADWVEIGSEEPDPMDGFEAVPLGDVREMQAEVERLRDAMQRERACSGRHMAEVAALRSERDELLACLRDCVEYVDEVELKHVAAYGEHHHAARLARVREDAKMARAAIARAEGGAA